MKIRVIKYIGASSIQQKLMHMFLITLSLTVLICFTCCGGDILETGETPSYYGNDFSSTIAGGETACLTCYTNGVPASDGDAS